jgi:hypothetical protein
MGMMNQRKREKKRRQEKERARRAGRRAPLPYLGNKYTTEENIHWLLEAEVAIYETFVITERQLTDHQVESALERLIGSLRQGNSLDAEEDESVHCSSAHPEDFIIWNIRAHWRHLSESESRPSRSVLVGILRRVLGSVETWKSVSPTSRGYLSHLQGFLGQMGVSVQKCGPDGHPLPESGEEHDRCQDHTNELLSLGQRWCQFGDQDARADFVDLAESLIRSGQGEEVVEVCQRLMGEHGQTPFTGELSVLSVRAQKAMLAEMQ